jgi:SnoaL-like domain
VSVEELEQRLRALEERLRAVEDVQALQRLKARYGTLADARYDRRGVKPGPELERIAREISELFTEDAVWDGGAGLGVAEGRRAIYERFLEPTLLFSWHCFVKPEIALDGDRARGRWDILAPCTTRDGRPHWMAGFEEDEYRRVEGRWLHSRMKLGVVFLAPHETGWVRSRP